MLIHRHAGATCKLYTEMQLLGCVNVVCLLPHITCGNKLYISGSEFGGQCFNIHYCLCDILQRSNSGYVASKGRMTHELRIA